MNKNDTRLELIPTPVTARDLAEEALAAQRFRADVVRMALADANVYAAALAPGATRAMILEETATSLGKLRLPDLVAVWLLTAHLEETPPSPLLAAYVKARTSSGDRF